VLTIYISRAVPGWTTAIQSSTVLRTQQLQSSRECEIVTLSLCSRNFRSFPLYFS